MIKKPDDISQEDFDKEIQDEQRMIENFREGIAYTKEFIRSLNFEDNRRECLDYNEYLSKLYYYQERCFGHKNYIALMKSWQIDCGSDEE